MTGSDTLLVRDCPRCGEKVQFPDIGPEQRVACAGCGLAGPRAVFFAADPAFSESMAQGTLPGQRPAAAPPPAEMPDDPLAFPEGSLLAANFQIIAKLGAGAMGEVYLAQQRKLGRLVAIKVLKGATTGTINVAANQSLSSSQRFSREALALGRLQHANVLTVYEAGEEAGSPYLIFEYIEGMNLKQLIKSGQLPIDRALVLCDEILAGVEHAHGRGVIHRDLKPDNILLPSEGGLKIADFGLARLSGHTSQEKLTATGMIMGTPYYMSPEQVKSAPASPLSDIYSMGVILYEMLTGQVPYRADTVPELLLKHVREPIPDVRAKRADVPGEVAALITTAMAKDPAQRFATATAFRQALAAARSPSPAMSMAPGSSTAAGSVRPIWEEASSGPIAVKRRAAGGFSEEFLRHYEMVRTLGEGAMGSVYLMRQLKLDRLVAIKVVKKEVFSEAQHQRLLKEARLLASLNHAAIVGLHDVGTDGDIAYLVCEYVDGDTLKTLLSRKERLPFARALNITIQILDGLGAAHRQGVIHRDLKPANIICSREGRAKIADFGLARSERIESGASMGMILGTPQYMSPEQCRGQDVSEASDLYAVGLMLYQATVGQHPFKGPESLDYLVQHTSEAPPLARSLNPHLPEYLEKVLSKSLEKNPAQRFGTAADFLKVLLPLYKSVTSGPKKS